MQRFFISLLLFLCLPIQAAVYTWVDENGVKQFSDKPPATQQSVQTIEVPLIETVNTRVIPADALAPLPRTRQANSRPRNVVMYSAEWCEVCKRAKGYFQQQGISFSEKDIDKSRAARLEFQKLGGRGVPLILVGKRKLYGFSPASFEKIYRP